MKHLKLFEQFLVEKDDSVLNEFFANIKDELQAAHLKVSEEAGKHEGDHIVAFSTTNIETDNLEVDFDGNLSFTLTADEYYDAGAANMNDTKGYTLPAIAGSIFVIVNKDGKITKFDYSDVESDDEEASFKNMVREQDDDEAGIDTMDEADVAKAWADRKKEIADLLKSDMAEIKIGVNMMIKAMFGPGTWIWRGNEVGNTYKDLFHKYRGSMQGKKYGL